MTQVIVGNPPFTAGYKRIRRVVLCICNTCGGSGYLATKHGPKSCPDCTGTGNVERVINEIVHDE